ncbi:cardiolipin synthase [candidate division KSB1 bacterium]|nr:cardiolipin synthase [candidate division KSB1 bacterium]
MLNNLHVLSTIILTGHWLIVVGLSVRVITRRLPIGVSLAWLTVVFSVPFAGAAAYLVFGGKRLGAEWIARHNVVQFSAESALTDVRESRFSTLPPSGIIGETLCRQTVAIMGMPALTDNRMTLLQDYESIFDAWVESIDQAQKCCRLAFYIWNEGGRADDVVQALLRARNRGVKCQILIDAVGSKEFVKGKKLKHLRTAGIEVAEALPPSIRRRADLRYHRKMVVIDDRVGFAGSQNMVDPRFFKQEYGVGRWVDAVAKIEGPAVSLLANVFEQDWCIETGKKFETPTPWQQHAENEIFKGALVQVVPSGPAPHSDAIRQLLLTAIYSARKTLTLTSPYFVPDEAVLTALFSAALSGVKVTLIVPAKNDSLLVRYASAAHFDDLMNAGVQIAMFQSGLLHTKSLVVDESVCLFGSVNLDMRSFWLNFESSLFVYGSEFTASVVELQQSYLAQSVFVDFDEWRGRSSSRRFVENAFRLMGPLL